ncbi:MAG TPA: glycoside hydrolase family 65 protein [Candidatus Dormibacteraeota bacterium]
MSSPLSPAPVRSLGQEDLPPYLSNGVIGVRMGPPVLGAGVCVVSGLSSIRPVDQIEGFARAPYPLAGGIRLDGAPLAGLPDRVRLRRRTYDFGGGELRTSFDFTAPSGARAKVETISFCSRSLPFTILQEIAVEVDRPASMELTAGIDPSGIDGTWKRRETSTPNSPTPVVDGILAWETHGALSICGGAYTTQLSGGRAQKAVESADDLAPLITTYRLRAEAGRRYQLRQITALVPSAMHSHPEREATRLAAGATERGFDTIRRENTELWADIWKGRVVLRGAGREWQEAADAAFYYLHASAHASSLFSTSMFGLAYWPNYHYYDGHVMWDIEAFAFPPLLMTAPDTARALLQYRLDRTKAAQRNAALNGYNGMQFPWASGRGAGDELIRTNKPPLLFEQHVSLWIAKAFYEFAMVTGDDDFRREQAWHVVENVARWVTSRVRRGDRGYEVPEALGIAEQATPVDNNAFMNMACSQTLRFAAELARQLRRRQDAERWAQMASDFFVPTNRAGVIVQHDRFTASQHDVAASTPEPLAALLLFDYPVTREVMERTLRFHLDRVGPYLGYPMLNSILGAAAAWLGDRHRAAELLRQGYLDYLRGPYRETDEYSRVRFASHPPVGPFMANLGGFLTSCLLLFPNIRPGPEPPAGWCRGPVVLPEGWDAIEVERLWIRGRPAGLRAVHGARRATLQF